MTGLRCSLLLYLVMSLFVVQVDASVPGTPGTHGVPGLTATDPIYGSLFQIELNNALENTLVWYLYSPYPGPTSSPYGTLGLGPDLILVFFAAYTDGSGAFTAAADVPHDSTLFNASFNMQAAVFDSAGTKGIALSNSVNLLFWGSDLDVDADRDGAITPDGYADDLDEERWTPDKGAVFLCNNDDDDEDGAVDSHDNVVNGTADALDFAPVRVRAVPKLPSGWIGELTVDFDSTNMVRLFRNDAGSWSLFDPASSNPISAADLQAGFSLGIEALDFAQTASGAAGKWSGEVVLTLKIKDDGGALKSRDDVCLRVAPFVLHSNLSPGETVVATSKSYNQQFISDFDPLVTGAGAVFAPIDGISQNPSYGIWAQDAFEFGYSMMPAAGGPRVQPSVLRSPRGSALDAWTFDHCLGPDFGYVHKGWVRSGVGWIDWFGNLDCTPPLPGRPLGRIYTGHQGTLTIHPEVLAFLDAQQVQGPVLQIDTDWLLIGHVDEEICFVPADSGTPYRMLIPSTDMALQILQDLKNAGQGRLKVFEGKNSETTVNDILASTSLINYNNDCQAAIDGVRETMKNGLGIDEADIIDIPALFETWGGNSAIAYMPNMVNSVVLGDYFISADPFGPVDNGVDKFKEPVIQALTALGMTVEFVDDWNPYHQGLGEVHCGTNAIRTPSALPWWEVR